MFHRHQLKGILKTYLPGPTTTEVSGTAISRLDSYLTETARVIAGEAARGNYGKMTDHDVERGIDLITLRAVREFMQSRDTFAELSLDVQEKIRLIEAKK